MTARLRVFVSSDETRALNQAVTKAGQPYQLRFGLGSHRHSNGRSPPRFAVLEAPKTPPGTNGLRCILVVAVLSLAGFNLAVSGFGVFSSGFLRWQDLGTSS